MRTTEALLLVRALREPALLPAKGGGSYGLRVLNRGTKLFGSVAANSNASVCNGGFDCPDFQGPTSTAARQVLCQERSCS